MEKSGPNPIFWGGPKNRSRTEKIARWPKNRHLAEIWKKCPENRFFGGVQKIAFRAKKSPGPEKTRQVRKKCHFLRCHLGSVRARFCKKIDKISPDLGGKGRPTPHNCKKIGNLDWKTCGKFAKVRFFARVPTIVRFSESLIREDFRPFFCLSGRFPATPPEIEVLARSGDWSLWRVRVFRRKRMIFFRKWWSRKRGRNSMKSRCRELSFSVCYRACSKKACLLYGRSTSSELRYCECSLIKFS